MQAFSACALNTSWLLAFNEMKMLERARYFFFFVQCAPKKYFLLLYGSHFNARTPEP